MLELVDFRTAIINMFKINQPTNQPADQLTKNIYNQWLDGDT